MKKEYLNKKELEDKLKLTKAKYHRLDEISNSISIVCGGVVISSAILMILSAMFIQHVHLGLAIAFLTSICAIPISEKCFNKKKDNVRKEYLNVKSQLEDNISMDFEKKRYELEKKFDGPKTQLELIKNIILEKELLERYKKELNKYQINRVDNELKNEINTRNYTLQKLSNK